MYHIVYSTKYRKKVLSPKVVRILLQSCKEISKRYEIDFLEIGTDRDHVHFLVQSVPTYSPTKLVLTIKSLTAREIFKRAPGVKRSLWGGEFWSDGYYISTVGRHGTEKIITKYVKEQGQKKQSYKQLYSSGQLELFWGAASKNAPGLAPELFTWRRVEDSSFRIIYVKDLNSDKNLLLMPAKDLIHEAVKKALEKDAWTVTDDPLVIFVKDNNIAIDLGAEKLLIAEKGKQKIAIEVKSFTQPSLFYSFHEALGQYLNYETVLSEAKEDRDLYIAISSKVYDGLTSNYIVRKSLERYKIKLLIVDITKEKIVSWIRS